MERTTCVCYRAVAAYIICIGSANAQMGNSYITNDGLNRAPAVVLHLREQWGVLPRRAVLQRNRFMSMVPAHWQRRRIKRASLKSSKLF